jgi:uncharacterized protein
MHDVNRVEDVDGQRSGEFRGVVDPTQRIAIIVLAKLPIPGRVKTRLCPPCTPEEAALIAEASLLDTLTAVKDAVGARGDLFGSTFISLERSGFAVPDRLGRSGHVFDQCEGGLGERLAHAFATVARPAILIGMDTPQVTVELLVEAATHLHTEDSVIGPATDGGFWIIGLRSAHPRAFDGVPMSSDRTGVEQVLALRRIGLNPVFVSPLSDFDEFEEAVAAAALIPGSRMHTAVRRVADRISGYSQGLSSETATP